MLPLRTSPLAEPRVGVIILFFGGRIPSVDSHLPSYRRRPVSIAPQGQKDHPGTPCHPSTGGELSMYRE